MVRFISDYLCDGLDGIMAHYPHFFIGIRQHGVVMGLEFNHEQGAKPVMRHLYENGVWAIFSTLDPSILQTRAGFLRMMLIGILMQVILQRYPGGILPEVRPASPKADKTRAGTTGDTK